MSMELEFMLLQVPFRGHHHPLPPRTAAEAALAGRAAGPRNNDRPTERTLQPSGVHLPSISCSPAWQIMVLLKGRMGSRGQSTAAGDVDGCMVGRRGFASEQHHVYVLMRPGMEG